MFGLFNTIFAFAWIFSAKHVAAFCFGVDDDALTHTTIVANVSYSLAVMLPGLAVAVRRLHDVGKSGWMFLVALIPIVGGIWLLVLMLTDGEWGENRYGSDPKLSPETFSESARLKSAGVVLIVAFTVMIFHNIYMMTILTGNQGFSTYYYFFAVLVPNLMLLAAGIFLLKEKTINEMHIQGKIAFILLLTAFSISFILSVINWKNRILNFDWSTVVYDVASIINTLCCLSLVLFAGFILFSRQNKKLIRNLAVLVIIFAGINMFLHIYITLKLLHYIYWVREVQGIYIRFVCFHLLPITYIVLVGTFLPGKRSN